MDISTVWNYFEKIYCINLPEDTERKNQSIIEFNKVGIDKDITWIAATRPPETYQISNYKFSGEFGCTLSHLMALTDSIGCTRPIAVFEDDVKFKFNTIDMLNKLIDNLPTSWSIIYLGGNPKAKLTKYNSVICNIGKFNQTTGYIVHPEYIKEIAKFIIDNLTKDFPQACADSLINSYGLKFNSNYCIYPPIVEQRAGPSSLRKGFRDYRAILQKHWNMYKP